MLSSPHPPIFYLLSLLICYHLFVDCGYPGALIKNADNSQTLHLELWPDQPKEVLGLVNELQEGKPGIGVLIEHKQWITVHRM